MNYDTTKLGILNTIIEPCEVVNIPSGDTPKAVSVRQPGTDGAAIDAWWTGTPRFATGDFVAIQKRNVAGGQYVIIGVSGGSSDIGSGAWPLPSRANIGATSYSDIDDFGDALANGDQGIIGEWQTTTDVSGGHATIPTGADVKGSGVDVTILTSADSNGTLLVAGATLLEQMTVTNTNSSNGLCVGSSTTNITLRADTVKVVCESASGYNQGFFIQGTGELINCRAECAGGGTNDYAVWAYDNGSGADVTIRKGYYDGDVVAENSNAVIILDGPVITGSVTEVSSGSITGWYINSDDEIVVLPGGDVLLQGDAAPQSQTQRSLLDGIGYILDGGHPANPYPTTRDSDDAEFNNSVQGNNNTIGTHAGGDFWEWKSGGSYGNPTSYNINSSYNNHLYVLKYAANNGVLAVLVGNIATMGNTEDYLAEVVISALTYYNARTTPGIALRFNDTSASKFARIRLDDTAANGLTAIGSYDTGGGETTIFSIIIGHMTASIALGLRRYESGGNAYVRPLFTVEGPPSANKFSGNSQIGIQNMGANNTFNPDEVWIEFYNTGTNITEWIVDSYRRTINS